MFLQPSAVWIGREFSVCKFSKNEIELVPTNSPPTQAHRVVNLPQTTSFAFKLNNQSINVIDLFGL